MSSDLGLTTGGMFSSHGFNLSVTFEHLIWRWNVGKCGQSKWRGLVTKLSELESSRTVGAESVPRQVVRVEVTVQTLVSIVEYYTDQVFNGK